MRNGTLEVSVVAISESGYINATLFVECNNHFINNRVLLLLEGHITLKKSASINLGQREWYHNACHNNCLTNNVQKKNSFNQTEISAYETECNIG